MPTYHARNVKISLATSSLADSTIAEPGRRRDKTGPVASEQYEVIVQTSKILKENFIPCPDGHRNLWLLGRDENIPFYLVRVGDEVFKQSDGPDAEKRSMRLRSSGNTSLLGPGSHITSSLSYGSDSEQSMADSLNIARLGASIGPRRRPGLQLSLGNLARHNQDNIQQEIPILSPLPSPILSAVSVDPDAIPRALSLKIELSRNAFLTNLRGNDVEDIRYDVFYNGELADSNYVPHASARVGDTGSVVRFISGKRVHMFVERPWIITRPGQDAKGELRLKNTAKRSTAQDRWDLIREALRREAQQLEVSASGIKSPVAEFLMSLAAVDLPAEVESRYKSGTPKFGVIDVVLSTGTGVKKSLNAPFLVRPSTLSPVKYSNGLSPGLDMHISNPDLQASPAATRARSVCNRTSLITERYLHFLKDYAEEKETRTL
jgi:hypothetical protein